MSACTFADNQAIGGSHARGGASGQGLLGSGNGGGLFNDHSTTVKDSTFIHNEALGGSYGGGGGGLLQFGRAAGGGIESHVTFSPVILTVDNCTFADNRAVGGDGNASGLLSGDGTGGGLSSSFGAVATVRDSLFIGNQAIGGQGAPGLVAPDGLGGGIFSDGQSRLAVTGGTITENQAIGGAAGVGGVAGRGDGGGLYLASGGVACLDLFTQGHTKNNKATSDSDDIFGWFTTC